METLSSLIDAAHDSSRAGAWREALMRYEEAFSRVAVEADAAQAADLLRWIGETHRQRGRLELAEEAYEASLAIAEANGLDGSRAAALYRLALVDQFRRGAASAEPRLLAAREVAERLGDDTLTARIDRELGTAAMARGDTDAARDRYDEALARFRDLDEDRAVAAVLNELGRLHLDTSDWEAAEAAFDEAFKRADHERDMQTLGAVELNRAELHHRRRAYAEARDYCDRAFETFGRMGSDFGRGQAYKLYGAIYRETGKPHLARDHLHQAVVLAHACHDPGLEAEIYSEMALVDLSEGKNRDALQTLTRAYGGLRQMDARGEVEDGDRRFERLQELFLEVSAAWAEGVESKDRYTAGHCQRVADYGCMLAEVSGIGDGDLIWFRMGAYLHDVGKVAVPPEVLNKPGELTPEEWRMVQRHTLVGDKILAPLELPWNIRPMVRSHHEHWDGTGYPDGLSGEEIPLTARILTVADVYDALTSRRSYRPALPQPEALRIMDRDAGRVLDPTLFQCFQGLLREPGTDSPTGGRGASRS